MNSSMPVASDADVRATLRGVDVDVEVSIDRSEVQRRAEAGIAGRRIAGLQGLGALLRLPEAVPVDVSAVAASDIDLVSALEGAVDFPAPGMIRRDVRPAVCPLLVSIRAERWRDGMRLAGRFAPYSARRVVLPRTPEDIEGLCMEAAYWGIGVSLGLGEETEQLVPPAPFRPVRYTAAAWKLDEDLYAQL